MRVLIVHQTYFKFIEKKNAIKSFQNTDVSRNFSVKHHFYGHVFYLYLV